MSSATGGLSFERPRVWMPIGAVIILVGLVLTFQRFFSGLGAVTNLTDSQPWGLWVGFDVLCGVALAAGGFVLTGIVHLLNFERYKSVLRPTVLSAFLGYILVSVGLLWGDMDFGRSVCRAVQACFDTDCNGATVGSVLGIMLGGKGIPARWTAPLNGQTETSLAGMNLVEIESLVRRSVKLMKRMQA